MLARLHLFQMVPRKQTAPMLERMPMVVMLAMVEALRIHLNRLRGQKLISTLMKTMTQKLLIDAQLTAQLQEVCWHLV